MVVSKIVNQVGEYGPYLMLVFALPILWSKKILLYYLLAGLCLNILLNATLKFIFKHPRPSTQMSKFEAIKKQTDFISSFTDDPFGFPSGHSQTASYITTMVFYAIGIDPTTIFFIMYTLFIMWQRVYTKNHYVYQVIAGAITGAAVATGVYYSYKLNIIGKIFPKLDDWSRIS